MLKLTMSMNGIGSGRAGAVTALFVILGVGLVSAQRPPLVPIEGTPIGRAPSVSLAPPGGFKIQATPTWVTIAWRAVRGAASYTVERATLASGPWTSIPWDPRFGTQIAFSSPLAQSYGSDPHKGLLLYYRISAIPDSKGEPGVVIVPYVTPSMEAPVLTGWRQDHGDLEISWSPVPGAVKYLVTSVGGTGGNRLVEVDPQYTSLRLPGLILAGYPGASVNIAVNARFELGFATQDLGVPIVLAPVSTCWPSVTSATGPAPGIFVSRAGVTSVFFDVEQLGYTLVERSLAGSQVWEPVRCHIGAVGTKMFTDRSLQQATTYDYRSTLFLGPTSGTSPALRLTTKPPVDTPALSAGVSGNIVNLSWPAAYGAEGYRIQSSYGYSLFSAAPVRICSPDDYGWVPGTFVNCVLPPPTLQVRNAPSGTHVFTLTVLYPVRQPSIKPPSQVTVVVP